MDLDDIEAIFLELLIITNNVWKEVIVLLINNYC